MSELNLYRTESTTKKCKTEKKLKSKKWICSEVTVNSLGNPRRPIFSPEEEKEEKEGYGGKDLQKMEVLSLE